MIVLGIETSCDETAAALVTGARGVLADLVLSQCADHAPYGGVVPEIAARSHVDHLDGLIARAMADAGVGFAALDGVAATAGPGLIGAVMVGLMTGKAIAAVHDLPLLAVNHLEGHALSPRLIDGALEFPYLLLLVSGGHCQLLLVEEVNRYRRLGTTIDDAVGEAFDKAAMLLDLGYPGGPAIERAARDGDPLRIRLPRPLLGRPGCDFSFSGLKTAVLHAARSLGTLDERDARRHRRVVPAGGRRRAGRPHGECDRAAARRGAAAGGAGGGGRRGGQRRNPAAHGGAGREPRAAAGDPAAPALHRQCGDDRLGRDRAAVARADRPARRGAARALAARRGSRSGRGRRNAGAARAARLSTRQPLRGGSPAQRKPTMSRPMSGGFLWR